MCAKNESSMMKSNLSCSIKRRCNKRKGSFYTIDPSFSLNHELHIDNIYNHKYPANAKIQEREKMINFSDLSNFSNVSNTSQLMYQDEGNNKSQDLIPDSRKFEIISKNSFSISDKESPHLLSNPIGNNLSSNFSSQISELEKYKKIIQMRCNNQLNKYYSFNNSIAGELYPKLNLLKIDSIGSSKYQIPINLINYKDFRENNQINNYVKNRNEKLTNNSPEYLKTPSVVPSFDSYANNSTKEREGRFNNINSFIHNPSRLRNFSINPCLLRWNQNQKPSNLNSNINLNLTNLDGNKSPYEKDLKNQNIEVHENSEENLKKLEKQFNILDINNSNKINNFKNNNNPINCKGSFINKRNYFELFNNYNLLGRISQKFRKEKEVANENRNTINFTVKLKRI